MAWAGFCMAAHAVAEQRDAPTPAHGLVVVTELTLWISCFALVAVRHHTFLL